MFMYILKYIYGYVYYCYLNDLKDNYIYGIVFVNFLKEVF